MEEESSGLVTSYESTESQYNSYVDMQNQIEAANNGVGDQTIGQQISFDYNEILSLEASLASQGLIALNSNGTPITDADGFDIIVQKQVQALVIAPFTAEAGQIYLFGNQIQGTGTLDAPDEVSVNITNYTIASLEIQGITVPQNIGGVYVNGALLDDGSVVADNAAVNTANQSGSGAAFNITTLSPPPAPPSPGGTPLAAITITNKEVALTAAQVAEGLTQPDIIVDGAIDALFSSLTISSFGDIDVTDTATIDVFSQNFTAANNITIDEVQFYGSGDPSGQILGSPAVAETALPNGEADILSYENSPAVAVNPTTGAQLVSQTIEIDAEYVDINGSITAGQANETLTLNPSDVDSEIAQFIKEGASSPQALALSPSEDPNNDFLVFYNPANGGSIEVQPVSLAGGTIIIKGHVASTSTATLYSYGYYGDVTINNNTTYNLTVDSINAQQAGSGLVDITDLNQTDGNNNVLETKYLSTAGGGMTISTNYVNPTTDVAAGAGTVTTAAQLVITGSISGTTLTITGITLNGKAVTANVLTAGDILVGAGVLSGTTIVKQISSSEVVDGVGEIGGLGTYQISTAPSQTITNGSFTVSNSAVFTLQQGLRYNFTVEYGTQTVNSRTYSTSAWLGAINLGNSTNYTQGTPVVVGQPTVLASSLYFFLDGGEESSAYIYSNTAQVTNDPTYTPYKNWTTSTWYGKKTYYEEAQETVDTTNIADTSIKADMPVMVQFTGTSAADITINSPYSNVQILGNLSNVTGTTSITAGGTITLPTPNTNIEGVNVTLSAGGNIGSSSQPINVVLAPTTGLAALPTSQTLNFGTTTVNNNQVGTITLTNGQNWSSLGYTAGSGIYVQGTDADANGATFNPSSATGYYKIASVNGDELILTAALLGSSKSNVHDSVAPVVVDIQGGLVGTPAAAQVNFSNTGTNGVITLTNGTDWSNLGYQVGEGIYISSGANTNEAFNAADPGTYYTITAMNGSTLTLAELLGTTGSNVTADFTPVSIGSSVSATTTNGAIYINSPTEGLQVGTISAGGDRAVSVTALGSIMAAGGNGGFIGGGNVTIDAAAGGSVGLADAPIELSVGQESADQLNLTATGDVYLEQKQGNLPIFKIDTDGAVNIDVDNGSVVNVNTNIQQDPRTVAELEQGVWTSLQLTAGTGGEASIESALSEYQSSQQNEYETYWTYQNELVNGEVVLPTSDISYYTSVYQAEALTKYAATDTTDINNFVNTSISTLELAATQQYYSLAAIYGPGGTYAQSVASGASNFDGATNSQVTASTSSAETLAADIIYGNVNGLGTLTLAVGGSWASLGYAPGEGIYINSSTDPNSNGATFGANAANPYYTIGTIVGNVMTLTTSLTVDESATVNIAPVTINSQTPNQSTAGTTTQTTATFQSGSQATQVSFLGTATESVAFGNTGTSPNKAGTITLTNGSSWSSLGFTVGSGIFVGSSTDDTNANGASFDASSGNPYYTIAAINGNVLTLQVGETFATPESSATVSVAAVTIGATPSASTLTPSTITLAEGGSWQSLGYTVGQGIFVGSSTDVNSNGATFNASSANAYYTITGINGDVLTVSGQLTTEATATVNLAPVAIAATPSQSTLNAPNTITLSGGVSGYSVGGGIFVGSSSDPNSNGGTFTGGNYYTITAINGDVLTLSSSASLKAQTTLNVAPVTVGTTPSLTSHNVTTYSAVQTTVTSSLNGATPVAATVNFSNTTDGTEGLITLTSGTWNTSQYTVGDGIFVGSATDANANGTSFTANSANGYYTITAISGSTITVSAPLVAEKNVNVTVAPVTITSTPTNVSIDAYNPYVYDPNFTYLMTQAEVNAITGSIKVFSPTELLSAISAGLLNTTTTTQTDVINSTTANIIASSVNITAKGTGSSGNIGSLVNPYTQFSTPNTIGYVVGTSINGTPVQLALASAEESDLNFLQTIPVATTVNFSGDTMTLANGEDWSNPAVALSGTPIVVNGVSETTYSLATLVANSPADSVSLFVGGSTLNATENGAYLVIDSVSGSTVTFKMAAGTSLNTETSQQVLVAPVVTNLSSTDKSSITNNVTPTAESVIFGNDGNSGTITLVNGTWDTSKYTVGQGIYVGSTDSDPDSNGATFSASPGGYYTIGAISGSVLTLQWGETLTPESGAQQAGVQVTVAPVTIDIQSGAANVKYVLITQSRDIGILPASTGGTTTPALPITASATGFIYLASGNNDLDLTTIVSTSGDDVRVRTEGNLINDDPSGVNVEGGDIVLEGGQGYIGTLDQPVTIEVDTGGNLTARALDDIYITAKTGDIPVEGIYTPDGGVYLIADDGSIYDAIQSDYAKIEADWIELYAPEGYIGGSTAAAPSYGTGDATLADIDNVQLDALHVDTVYTGSTAWAGGDSGALRVYAKDSIDIDQTNGDLDLLDAYSVTGDVMLDAQGNIYSYNLSDPTNINSSTTGQDANASIYGNNIWVEAGIGMPGTTAVGGIGGGAVLSSILPAGPLNIVSSFSSGADTGKVTALSSSVSATSTAGYIYLDEVNIQNEAGLTTTSNGDIQLESVSTGTFGIAFITALDGNILSGRSDDTAIVKSGMTDLIAGQNVGQASYNGTIGANKYGGSGFIVSTTGNIEAEAVAGSIWLWNIGALVVGGVSSVSSPFALYAQDGTITIRTSSPLDISEDVEAADDIVKQAGQSAEDDDNLTVESGVTITSTGGSITLGAGNNITLDGSTTGQNALAGATLSAADAIILDSGDFDTSSATDTDDITVQSGASLTAGTTVTFNSPDNITIGAATVKGVGITLNAGTDYTGVDVPAESTSTLINTAVGATDGTTNDVNLQAGANLNALTGSLAINAANNVTIGAAQLTGASITVNAGNQPNTTAASDGTMDSVTFEAGSVLDATTTTLTVNAGNDITLDGPVVNGLTITTAGASLTAETAVLLDAGSTATTNPTNASDLDSVTVNSGASIQSTTSSITIQAPNDITIDGVGTAPIGAAQLTAATTITLQAGYLPAIAGFGSNNVTVNVFGSFTAPTLNVDTGGGADTVEFSPYALDANTFVNTGAGNDVIHVYGMPDLTTYANYLSNDGTFVNTVNLDGGNGADTYIIDATDATNYVINVNDSGTDYLDGQNNLIINGAATGEGQEFLLRTSFVAILESNGAPVYQRINYNNTITGALQVNGGNVSNAAFGNFFYLDGNSAVTTINAGDGADFFQVGQVYATTDFNYSNGNPILDSAPGALVGGVGALAGDGLNLTEIQLGVDPATYAELSDGVDYSTVLYGGAGTDTFEVYANQADLSMIGGSGNDTFIVRAFLVAAGTHIGVQGGSGNDTIEYNVDAPVDIEGGTGFNTLVLLGTAANDTFVVTQDGIFGGGLNITYTNIQAVTIDGLEGNDTIYVESTPQDVVTTINGGAGDDTTIVGGDVTGAVISSSSQGSSSVTDNAVTSNDSQYNNIFAAGLQVTVGNTSGGAVISQPSQAVVHVGDPSSITSFTVSAPTGLVSGQTAYVNVTPTLPSAEWGAEHADSLQVSVDGGQTWSASAVLAFSDNSGVISGTQTVLMRAAPTTNFSYTRNETIVVASTIFAVGGTPTQNAALDSLVLPVVKVTLETSATALVIDQGIATTTNTTVDGQQVPITTYAQQASTIVAGQTTYTYNLSLNQQPAAGQTVTVTLAGLSQTAGASTPTTSLPSDIVLSGSGVVNNGNGTYSVTFELVGLGYAPGDYCIGNRERYAAGGAGRRHCSVGLGQHCERPVHDDGTRRRRRQPDGSGDQHARRVAVGVARLGGRHAGADLHLSDGADGCAREQQHESRFGLRSGCAGV